MSLSESEKTAHFTEGLAVLIADLEKVSRNDQETVLLIGSLATNLIDKAEKPSWPELKSGLDGPDYDRLLATFLREGDAAQAEGKTKIAYAIQALATSLVGSHLNDQTIREGTGLLDQFIMSAVDFYRRNAEPSNRPN